MGRYEQLLRRVDIEIPGVKVKKHQDSYLMKVIHFSLKVLTRSRFVPSAFTTTIGKTMNVPNFWDDLSDNARYITLRHELVHLRQFRRWPIAAFDLPVLRLVNFMLFSFCYLFVLPTRRTLRAKFEREAYTQTMLAYYDIHGQFSSDARSRFIVQMSNQFGGPSYFKMWNSYAAAVWANRTMNAIEAGKITNNLDRIY